MNKVILVGRIVRDPELRSTNTGKSVATFSLAVDRRFKQEGQPEADFFNIVAWGRQAEVICQYLGKGRQIALTGRLQSRSYDAQDGSKRYVTEVVLEEFDFIGSKNDSPAPADGLNSLDLGDDFSLMADDDEPPF
ncbi:single-stranded DNA-binding protein [Eubacterium maltosivorans]|uniref:Single-stranded DNA-binding protein n=1 Tax=Eubacterium maltosivorans TaxID=2041044 RepID=A0A4P9C6K3_EUBML|nr:single-stranded DNA-binding protein [Eubacterium maltosivorans]QCT71109.1 single-stranded DNA-binding protein [Eubacterium maltosivorans]